MSEHLQNELKIMAQAVMTMEQDLHKLDMLELEILAVKAGYKQQLNTFKNAICGVLGYLVGQDDAADFIRQKFHTDNATLIPDNNAFAPTTKINGSIADNKN